MTAEPNKWIRLGLALAKWKRTNPKAHAAFIARKPAVGHGAPSPPPFEAMLTDDPELHLATAELHDPCSGDCEGLCECDESGA